MNTKNQVFAFESLICICFSLMSSTVQGASRLTCSQLNSSGLGQRIHAFLVETHSIDPSQEISLGEIGVVSKWELERTTGDERACFGVMSVCTTTGKDHDCSGGEKEVVGIKRDLTGAVSGVVPFEALYHVPAVVTAKVGEIDSRRAAYYVQLKGASAVDALKSWVTKTPYTGFSGIAVRGNKSYFDPTPNRSWYISNAAYSLRRGLTAEVLDIAANQLDGPEPNEYWEGCQHPQMGINDGRCLLAPWYESLILDILAE